jgi:hypothetical protein
VTEVVVPKQQNRGAGVTGVTANLLPSDVASLEPLGYVKIRQLRVEEVANSIRQLMKLAVQKSKEKKKEVEIQAFSGEGDPRVWNACRAELEEVLGNGIRYNHLIGPVVCTDSDGNAILDVLEKYPERVHLRLFTTRYPYHWVRLTWQENGERLFELRGEAYHVPLSENRWTYEVLLDKKNDPSRADKLLTWYSREQNYTENIPITREIKSVDELDVITIEQLRKVLGLVSRASNSFHVHPYDLMTGSQILEKARN